MSESKKAMTKGAPEPAAKAPAEGEAPRGWLSWALGWVLVPGIILGLIFGGGVLVGAHHPDSWLSRLVVWVVELFS